MHWIRVTRPTYEQSRRYKDQVGEVVGRWGPDNSVDGRDGYLVEFADGEVVGIAEDELQEVEPPAAAGGPQQGGVSGRVTGGPGTDPLR